MKTLPVNRKYFVLILVVILIGFGIQGSYGQTITALVPQPLTEANLHGSIVTLTLSGGTYERSSFRIRDAVMVSGIDGVTVDIFGVDRVSDTEATVELEFTGNIDANDTLTFTVGAGAIADYSGNALTATVPVTAMEESLVASTEFPLTEANLHGSVVTLTLTGRNYESFIFTIRDAVSVSGIDGVTVGVFDVDRVSDTQVTVELTFLGDFDTDGTLTFTVGADAVAGYSEDFTDQVSVTALEESFVASTEFPLTEATLNESVITLTLTGRNYEQSSWDIERSLTVSGIDGVAISDSYNAVRRVSDTEVTVELTFDGDFDTDATLTFTVGSDAVAGYNEDFTVQVSVTAIEQSNATVSISPASVQSPDVGEEITFSLNITNGTDVAGYQAIVLYDRTALYRRRSNEGDYLASDGVFLAEGFFGMVTLVANTVDEASNGAGTLATLTFEVIDFKASTLTLSQVYLVDADGKRWEATTESGQVTEPPEPAEEIVGDINRDGVVDILDLTIVGARFGQRGHNSADLNGDGLVDIVDLVLVASEFGDEAQAPSLYPQALELLSAADLRQWLSQAQQLALTDPAYLRGITVLEQLHAALIPQETVLLPNYPNPFNPETWIPYRLSHASDVDITIYDTRGMVVRRLDLGHQMAGYYTDRTKAAYWNGRNEHGESVASGIYFYQLRTGDYTALRRMVILK